MLKRSITGMAAILIASQAVAQWSANTEGGFAAGSDGAKIGNNLSGTYNDLLGDRARVAIMDTLPGEHSDTNIYQMGIESRVRDISDTLSGPSSNLPRFGFGANFDACKSKGNTTGQYGNEYNTLITQHTASVGVQTRALMLSDVWNDNDYPATPPEVYQIGIGAATEFLDPNGAYLRTGWAKVANAGMFSIHGDNHHFWDDTAAYPKLSIHSATALLASYSTGNFPGKGTDPYACEENPDSPYYGGSFKFGSHVGLFDGLKVETMLRADYDAGVGSYNGTYDKVDEWTGVRVTAPTKKISTATTSVNDQQTIADRSFNSATGVLIEAPAAPVSGASGPIVSPSNYLGLKANAKAEFNDDVKITDVLILPPKSSAPASPAEGTVYINSSTNKLMFYVGGSWRTVTSTP
jgi:hypothetical protein